jgi:hypothetical protein
MKLARFTSKSPLFFFGLVVLTNLIASKSVNCAEDPREIALRTYIEEAGLVVISRKVQNNTKISTARSKKTNETWDITADIAKSGPGMSAIVWVGAPFSDWIFQYYKLTSINGKWIIQARCEPNESDSTESPSSKRVVKCNPRNESFRESILYEK